jgi:ankyrin repeat protein
MWAIRAGYLEVSRELLARGADVNAKDLYGWTALRLAGPSGHRKEIEELLRAYGGKR